MAQIKIKEEIALTDGLEFKPPTGIPDQKAFGGTVENGDYQSTIIGWRLNPNNPDNAWVEFTNDEFPDEGKFSMNVFLPTKAALNQKASELKGTVPDAELKATTLKKFFHYGMTLKVAGIDPSLQLKEALDALVGWHGLARYKSDNYGCKVTEILSAKQAKASAKSRAALGDMPF